MRFGEAVRRGLAGYVSFGGRATRPEFWWFVLFLFLAWLACALVEEGLYQTSTSQRSPITDAFKVAALLPALAVGFRRLQDTGVSGWVMLLPAAILIAILVLGWRVFQVLWTARGAALDGVSHWFSALRFAAWLAAPTYLTTLLLLAVFLTRPSEPGPNRHGPMPTSSGPPRP